MDYRAFIAKYAEIGVKGNNRNQFEDALVRQLRIVLKEVDGTFTVTKTRGRIYVEAEGPFDYDDAVAAMRRVFGVSAICPMCQYPVEDVDSMVAHVVDYMKDVYAGQEISFKVETRRANKKFAINSQEINALLGEKILEACPNTRVDVHQPDVLLRIEIREKLNIYSSEIPGPGGMPVGTNGKAMLLLSGGIDSPVAAYMVAKRGVKIDAVYFHAPPYTSERAKQKVVDLAKIISRYTGPIPLRVVNFTDVQMEIYQKCPHDQLTIIMRRYMMRIAEHFALEHDCLGLVTGESIGQVASQTMQSMLVTNEVCTLPVYRPCVGLDKQEIVEKSQEIGTFETSILPYEDCCTIFVAKHPVTKPTLKSILKSEAKLDEHMEELVRTAVETAELIWVE